MDRNQTLLYMIADLYSENKQLKDEVSYLKKDNDDFKNDTEIAEKEVKELKEKVVFLMEKLGRIADKLEPHFDNKKPLEVEEIGKLLFIAKPVDFPIEYKLNKKGGLSNDN